MKSEENCINTYMKWKKRRDAEKEAVARHEGKIKWSGV
jgi:hypothetical protein